MNRYLLDYIRKNSSDKLINKYLDFLKVDLDGFFYGRGGDVNSNYGALRELNLKFYLKTFYNLVLTSNAIKYNDANKNILSFISLPKDIEASFNINMIGSILRSNGNKIIKDIHSIKLYILLAKLNTKTPFNEILTKKTAEKLESYNNALTDYYKRFDFKGLFVSHGEPFINKFHIDIFKKLNIPSFIFLHGLPAIYDLETEKKSDYLLVWSEKIRDNYIAAGFEKSRIVVTGHPQVLSMPPKREIRNSLDDILVITTASNVWSPHNWDYNSFPDYDSSLLVLYCYSIQTVLQRLGINKVRLRLHPSVNKSWLLSFINRNFFILDTDTLETSIRKSSLVIGPTSTVCLQSMLLGVNYIVYELGNNKCDIHDFPLVPPFDGSDKDLIVTHNEDDLLYCLRSQCISNMSFIEKYVQPFDFTPVYKLLK